ncbi:hypothetical protein KOW79_013571 [Hemibagrus wyckioides]|uniref:Uncharacterized protein n=1 Tax=Hemibagrus wyckioides TaxID=337641 RepID=A0A9D3SLQ8_9TELE|nr:hypothetical protein KOW79_013571 [Hemibagrus wyckioides]
MCAGSRRLALGAGLTESLHRRTAGGSRRRTAGTQARAGAQAAQAQAAQYQARASVRRLAQVLERAQARTDTSGYAQAARTLRAQASARTHCRLAQVHASSQARADDAPGSQCAQATPAGFAQVTGFHADAAGAGARRPPQTRRRAGQVAQLWDTESCARTANTGLTQDACELAQARRLTQAPDRADVTWARADAAGSRSVCARITGHAAGRTRYHAGHRLAGVLLCAGCASYAGAQAAADTREMRRRLGQAQTRRRAQASAGAQAHAGTLGTRKNFHAGSAQRRSRMRRLHPRLRRLVLKGARRVHADRTRRHWSSRGLHAGSHAARSRGR